MGLPRNASLGTNADTLRWGGREGGCRVGSRLLVADSWLVPCYKMPSNDGRGDILPFFG